MAAVAAAHRARLLTNPDKGTASESQRRKTTGPRFLRDEHLATKDPKTAELPKDCKTLSQILRADFLTEEQKRDIFYNNTARFLRLSQEEIARHHGKGTGPSWAM